MISRLKTAANTLGGILFLTMFVVFILQITARFGFNKPLAWTDELVVILYVWVILWSAAFIVPEKEHVAFDLIWNSVGKPTRRVMKIVGNLLLGGLALWAVPATWDYVNFMAREGTPVLGIPFKWVFLPFVFLFVALGVRAVLNIRAAWRGEGLEAELNLQ